MAANGILCRNFMRFQPIPQLAHIMVSILALTDIFFLLTVFRNKSIHNMVWVVFSWHTRIVFLHSWLRKTSSYHLISSHLIIISSHLTSGHLDKASIRGAINKAEFSFIHKPYDLHKLLSAVKNEIKGNDKAGGVEFTSQSPEPGS